MAFRQFTTCVRPDRYVNVSVTYRVLTGLVTAILALVAGLVTSPLSVALGYSAIVLLIALISFLYWWLNGRLICLSDTDQCVLGVVLGRPSVQPFKKAGDDDASIYVVLAPSPVNLNPRLHLPETIADDPPEVYWGNPVQGAIVTPQNAVLALGRGYVSDADHVHYLKPIHSEFEGSGMDDLLKWAVAILAILIAAMILTAIPGLGWLGLLLKILAGLITHTPDAVRAARDFWCDAIGKAEEAEGGGSRDDPAQNWVVHPLVDGCSIRSSCRRHILVGGSSGGPEPRASRRPVGQHGRMTKLTGQQIADEKLDGWTYVVGGLQTRIATPDFATGLAVVDAIGAAAEEMNHHPDLGLSYTHVDVRLSSHDAQGVTDRDIRLARRITAIAVECGTAPECASVSRFELALDSPAYPRIMSFWGAVLAMGGTAEGDDLRDPYGVTPLVWFQNSGSEEPRQRWHPDVWVDPAQVQPRIDAALAAGGRLVSDTSAPSYWVLADPEGNRVCLCTWQERHPTGREG